jgi:hypothetical protein
MQWETSAQQCPLCKSEKNSPALQWTGDIVEWVELLYGLYLTKKINHGNITLKKLFREMGEIFDFDVKEFAVYFMNIKGRTDANRTKFTDEMKNALLERMSESDMRPSKK